MTETVTGAGTDDWQEAYCGANRGRRAFAEADSRRSRTCASATSGRKSPLALALREVRDRESGHAAQRRSASGSRRRSRRASAALADEELDRRLREEVVDVTLPGEELPLGHLHPITQVRRAVEDAFLGLG